MENEFNLKMKGRPRKPYKALKKRLLNGNTITFARHHIIPLDTLNKFYNKTIEKKEVRHGADFFKKTVNKIMSRRDVDNLSFSGAKKFIKKISNKNIKHIEHGRRMEGHDDFAMSYAWMPANLFIGPENRGDDPKDKFEKKAAPIVGNDKFNLIKKINDNMESYCAKGNEDKGGAYYIFNDLKKLLKEHGEINKLNLDLWGRSGENMYIRRA